MNLSRKETIAALEPLKSAFATKSAVQELSHIWFDEQFAYATNGGIGVKVKFTSSLKCGVPGALFLGLLNQTSADTVEFTSSGDELKFKIGRSNVKLATLPFDRRVWRYPEKPTAKPTAVIRISEAFLPVLKRMLSFKHSVQKRMEHHAICVYAVEGEMDLYVTDSKSLMVMPVAEPLKGTVKKVALPLELGSRILATCKEPGPELKMYPDHFVVQATDSITLYSNVFDTSEMYDIPKAMDHNLNDKAFPPFAFPEDLTGALERATLMAGSDDPVVTLRTQGKSLKLTGGRFKFGQIDEDFPLTKAAPKAMLAVNAKTLLSIDGAKQMSLSDKVTTLRGDGDFVYMLMGQDSTETRQEEAREPAEAEED